MRKRIVSIVFATVLAASLAACGFSSKTSGGAAEDQIIENTANAQDEAKAESGVAALDSKSADSSKAEIADSSTAAATDSSSASKPIKAEEITETPKPTKAPEKPAETKKSIGDYNPDDVKVTFERVYADDKESGKISATYKGEEIWSKTTGSYPVSQLDTVKGLSKYNKKYYYVEKGSIVCVDLATGDELWRNSEFLGSPAEWAYGFGGDGTLYISGYLGPDLFVCSPDGKTVQNIGSFREDFYWPYELTYYEDAKMVKLVYEMSPYGDGGTLYISTSDYTAHEEKDFNNNSSSKDNEDGPIYYPNVKNFLSLREGPSTDSARKKKIYPGTALVVLGYENGMARVRVRDTGETGYVNPDYIKAADSSGSEDGPIYYPNVQNFLSLREGPSTDSARKKKIYPGTALVVLGYENGMARVRVQDTGETGYVNPDYIKAAGSSGKKDSSGSKDSSNSDLKPGMTAYANVKEYLSLRDGPSTSANVIRKLPDWAELTILEYPQGKMVKVRDEESGLTGYVHTDFLSY